MRRSRSVYARMRCLNRYPHRRSRARAVLPASSSPSLALRKKPTECGMTAPCSTMLRPSATSRLSVLTVAWRQSPHSVKTNPNPQCLTSISQALPAAPGKKRKTASITIRLTEAEEAQLQERAAAAQLTVSAYLRSCIFEAESLRAQVKQALSQMKVTAALSPRVSDEPQSTVRSGWRARLIPRWSLSRDSA